MGVMRMRPYTAPEPTEDELRMLPRECGVALMGFGIVGVLLLDPFDVVFIVAGALVFTPQLYHKSEHWMQARFPGVHRRVRRHIDRFIDDFERRYPQLAADSTSPCRK
jgi:hypothetical protein